MAKMKWLLIALPIFIILFLFNSVQQRKLGSSSDKIFDIQREDIFSFDISKADENITLSFDGQSWTIDGNDSLIVKESALNGFFNNVLKVKRTSMISKNKNNWDKFNVGDSTGTILILSDHNNEMLSKVIIGSSKSEWSSSNIRINDKVEVYQTNENISWQLNTSPTYWGEVPKADTTAVD